MRTLITTDCHVSPPFSVFEDLPESYREWVPRVEHREDGDYLVNPRTSATTMGGMVESPDTKLEGNGLMWAAVGATKESHPSFEPAEVLADLARDGVRGAVLINRPLDWDDARPVEVDIAYCQLVNDWSLEHWGPYLDRVAPGILLPLRDVTASVKELERCSAKGMRPALLADGMSDPAYYSPAWEPMWEALSALNIPATMHVGTRQSAAGASAKIMKNRPYKGLPMVGWYMQCLMQGETLGELTFSGVFERHPDLHVVMTEGYAGWLAFAMQLWDHHFGSRFRWEHPVNAGPLAPELEAPPSYYIKRQAHATFMWDPLAIEVRHLIGRDCLLWGNDYPHPEGSFPHSEEWNDKQFADVPEADIDAITRGNAAKLFRINV
jgi:predicted TIM-barrel fold metal-dependent hydrolase